MLTGIQNVTDALALHFGGLLSFQKLAKSENSVQWSAQFVAHPGEKFALCFARAFDFVHQLALGYVFDRAFVTHDVAVGVSNGASVLTKPDFFAVLAENFVFEKL